MSTSLRERRRQALQDEIIAAAQELVASKGYAAMSMDELATQVGISKPTLYAYFKTKDDLVVAAATRDMQAILELIGDPGAAATPLARLRIIMQRILERHIHMHTLGIGPWPEIFQLLLRDPHALSCIEQIARSTTALVNEAVAMGEIDPSLDPEGVVHAFYGMASALPKAQISGLGLLTNPARVAATLVEIFERGVRLPRD